ncbi:MAG: TRAP transporter substrate-binding protein [Hydrogenophilaceae bacterium]|nr:TRAP transporter substrate-binding protein [Hydrogenophilaceae bacterium]
MNLRSLLLTVCLACALTPAMAAEPIIIKFSHVVAPNTPKGKAADYFKQRAEAATRGRVKVEVYPNSQLYKDGEEMEALQLGAVQMLAPSLFKFGLLGVRSFELFGLPYIFPNKDTLYRVMDGDIGRQLLAQLEAKGIVGLAYWDNGFKQMSADRPLRRVGDFQGLKLRVQPSEVIEAQMRALGGVPRAIPFSETYAALKNGVVDGTENPVSNLYTQRLYEVQRYMTISDHGYLGYAVIVNKRFWDGLPAGIRAALAKAMQEATAYERRIAQQENDATLAALKRLGKTEIHTLPLAGRIEWHKALLPVHKEFEEVIGRDLIQGVYNIAAQVERERQAAGTTAPRQIPNSIKP